MQDVVIGCGISFLRTVAFMEEKTSRPFDHKDSLPELDPWSHCQERLLTWLAALFQDFHDVSFFYVEMPRPESGTFCSASALHLSNAMQVLEFSFPWCRICTGMKDLARILIESKQSKESTEYVQGNALLCLV